MQPEELLPALITIDEPELGLHPSAVATVAQLIQAVSKKRQIIVATQSSRLIAAFAPEDIVVVERETDERAQFRVHAKPQNLGGIIHFDKLHKAIKAEIGRARSHQFVTTP